METSIPLCTRVYVWGGGGQTHYHVLSLSLSLQPESQLKLDCNIATNKTTGLVTISALWYIQGLESDVAAVGRYELRVHWGALHNNIPVFDTEIKTVLNYSASAVSDVKL